jgi:hypothetical protein
MASTRQGRQGRDGDQQGLDGNTGPIQRLSPEGKACLAALLAGIEPEFQVRRCLILPPPACSSWLFFVPGCNGQEAEPWLWCVGREAGGAADI